MRLGEGTGLNGYSTIHALACMHGIDEVNFHNEQ